MPMNIPKEEIRMKINRKIQLNSIEYKSPVNPINDLREMINSELATAFFIGSFTSNTRIGTIIKPPPIPAIPEISPSKSPIPTNSG